MLSVVLNGKLFVMFINLKNLSLFHESTFTHIPFVHGQKDILCNRVSLSLTLRANKEFIYWGIIYSWVNIIVRVGL